MAIPSGVAIFFARFLRVMAIPSGVAIFFVRFLRVLMA